MKMQNGTEKTPLLLNYNHSSTITESTESTTNNAVIELDNFLKKARDFFIILIFNKSTFF
jgi:hypothetical protein